MQLDEIYTSFEQVKFQIQEAPITTWETFQDYANPCKELQKTLIYVVIVVYGVDCRRNWMKVRQYFTKKDFVTRIVDLEPESVDSDLIGLLTYKLDKMDYEEIESVSHVAAMLYKWLQYMSKFNDVLQLARRIAQE
jgi:hypothetical protein